MPSRPPTIRANGKAYYICAVQTCQKPLIRHIAYSPCYIVRDADGELPDPLFHKQALCTECYLAQFQDTYPEAIPPDLPDNVAYEVLGIDPTRSLALSMLPTIEDDVVLWEQAIDEVRSNGFSETVETAYRRLKGIGIEVDRG